MSAADEAGVGELIAMALREDVGAGDVTTGLLAEPRRVGSFRVLVKERGVFAGREIAPAVLAACNAAMAIEWTKLGADGTVVDAVPAHLATIRGPIGSVLSAERVLLNFLQRLCGVATLTRKYVDAVSGTPAAIYDTRKTTPGWRRLEKYAVRCAGGCNHRYGLYDAVLIKDNHLTGIEPDRLGAEVFEMLNRLGRATARTAVPHRPGPAFVEVEADTPAAVEQLFKVVGIDVILLDNFSIDELREAVAMRDRHGLVDKVILEASGGVNLKTVRAIAQTGVERISVGAITHSATALDLSLERM